MPAFDALALDEGRVQQLLAAHPPTAGVLVLDDTGPPKKGAESVGVAAQYAGTLGKIGNCQVVVSAEYLADDPGSRSPFHWPVSAQLSSPESWTSDPARCQKAHVPTTISQQTQPEMALGLLDRARAWGVPIPLVVADSGYGDHPNLPRGAGYPPGVFCLRGGKHLWGALAPGGAGRSSPGANLSRHGPTAQVTPGPTL